jgi:hypothetical protein
MSRRAVLSGPPNQRPANHLRRGYGGPPKRSAEGEAGRYGVFAGTLILATVIVPSFISPVRVIG